MSDSTTAEPIPFQPPPPRRPRVKKLRLLLVLIPLVLLAIVSTLFGMMMAVAADVNGLDLAKTFREARNSVVLDVHGRRLGILNGAESRIILPDLGKVSPAMRNAVVAIEDRRFYTNEGVDLRGIARAFVADVITGKAVQGGSTITQQFVKNRLEAQDDRTVFQKLREAALAFHLSRRWSKTKILREYLNTVYFGNGAYGVETASRTYFGRRHPGCGTDARPCASELSPSEAALLAGMIASPTAYDPIQHPVASRARRNVVLQKLLDEGKLTPAQYQTALSDALPAAAEIEPPREKALTPATPYFTTWVRQQVVDRFGAQRAFEGGLSIRTTLDLDFQRAAERAITARLWLGGPSASLVAIDNDSGEVRAMVGGRDYNQTPFNLASQGQRQPGSAFKPFTLAQALREGISAGSVWPSRKRVFDVPHSTEKFVVNNYESSYAGSSSIATALVRSDNAVFAALGIHVGTKQIANLAERMGIRTPVSSNYAMTLGGLKEGVTPLDMAHAYETLAEGGRRVTGTLGAAEDGPVGIRFVENAKGKKIAENKPRRLRVLPQGVADQTAALMTGVVTGGTGKRAAVPGIVIAGKTGTTENYGDAWFVGFTDKYTIAVWVGYPDKLKPMQTEYHGQAVAGGTFPAEIFRDFLMSVKAIDQQRAAERALKEGKKPPTETTETLPAAPGAPAPGPSTPTVETTEPAAPTPQSAPSGGTGGGGATGGGGGGEAPAPAPAPATGGGGGGGGGAGGDDTTGGAAAPPPG